MALSKNVSELIHMPIPKDMPWGNCPAMQQLSKDVISVARSDRPVLITGPSGCGKELVAQTIHRLGSGKDSEFIPVNCGAIPETLIESELFGHERGAFTGAVRASSGYLGNVRDGTLFLDEVGELPLPQQTRLLRVLETRSFAPIGSSKQHEFRGRILTATHRDLETMVDQGRFREDLYYRIGVLVLKVPGLARRRSDIPDIVAYLCKNQIRGLRFSAGAMEMLVNADWPGNIRQLRNTIDRIAVLSDEDPVSRATVQKFLPAAAGCPARKLNRIVEEILTLDIDDKLTQLQESMIRRALEMTRGNKSAAGRLLGVHRKVIERKIQAGTTR